MSGMCRMVNIGTAGQKEAPKEACCLTLTGYNANRRTTKPVLFGDAQTLSKVHTYCSLQLQFLPHQYKLRIASCTHWTILKTPSTLSRGFNGSYELWNLYDYVAKLKNPNQVFARGFCVEFLGFPGSSVHRASRIFELGCAVPIERGE